ncbi:MAG: hypothetical protein ABI831_09555 [Betaproteobacteria bacterium]
MKTAIGLAFLVAAIILSPNAWDYFANQNLSGPGWMTQMIKHVGPAAIAWLTGIYLVATRSPASDM